MDTKGVIKARLESELTEAEQDKQQLEARLEHRPDLGPGQGATLAASWEMALARKEEVIRQIESLKESLTRLQDGTYGYCQVCNKPIDPERLKILPTTQQCTDCASKN